MDQTRIMTKQEFATHIQAVPTYLRTDIAENNVSSEIIEQRYIVPARRDDAAWLGLLRNSNDFIDATLITVTGINNGTGAGKNPIGGHIVFLDVAVDHAFQYEQGTDLINTEAAFLQNIFFLTYMLEKKQNCFPNATLLSYDFKLGIKPLAVPVHYGRGNLSFRIHGIDVS